MSDVHPVYIRCAAGGDNHADCCVHTFGDCVELLGPAAVMQFTPDDSVHLSSAVLLASRKSDTDKDVAWVRSKIAQALHVPAIPADLARDLLVQANNALGEVGRLMEFWRRECRTARALREAEIDDGK